MKLKQWKEEIIAGSYNQYFAHIYGNDDVDNEKKRYLCALDTFSLFFNQEEVELYTAPGRIEIGGNHTDHQHGKVLTAAIHLDMLAIVTKTEDNMITIVSDSEKLHPVQISSLEPKVNERKTSEALVRGVVAKLHQDGFKVGGFQAYITSNVLQGAGLSSSAAFEVLIGTILSGLYNEQNISATEIAIASQFSENYFFGKPCGLMDQMASSIGGCLYIDFEQNANPEVIQIDTKLPTDDYVICIVNTRGSHADLTDAYAAIPKEMQSIAEFFQKSYLCEVDEALFFKNISKLRTLYGDRAILRAIHFFQENERVKQQVEAWKEKDILKLLEYIQASGNSSYKYLQNVYCCENVKDQGIALGLALADYVLQGEGAHRIHGGGFAGTVQAFVPLHKLNLFYDQMQSVFSEGCCQLIKIRPCGGGKVEKNF